MGEGEMEQIGQWMGQILTREGKGDILAQVRLEVVQLCHRFPLAYENL
jgi:glycine/serine hydroxymethyltransferase